MSQVIWANYLVLKTISRIGVVEFVYRKEIDNFTVEVGIMYYGFEINDIISIDFLSHLRLTIDLDKVSIYK